MDTMSLHYRTCSLRSGNMPRILFKYSNAIESKTVNNERFNGTVYLNIFVLVRYKHLNSSILFLISVAVDFWHRNWVLYMNKPKIEYFFFFLFAWQMLKSFEFVDNEIFVGTSIFSLAEHLIFHMWFSSQSSNSIIEKEFFFVCFFFYLWNVSSKFTHRAHWALLSHRSLDDNQQTQIK